MVETRFQTSFIPKKPVVAGVAYRSEGQGIGLLSLIALILVIIAGLASLGIFLYGQFLSSNIEKIGEELAQVKESLDQSALNTFQSLGAKTASAEGLLKNHTAFSLVTGFLESVALKNVRFKDLSFDARPGTSATITLRGEAQSYAALASQVNALKVFDQIGEIAVSDITLDEKGNVTFSLKLKVSPDLFAYSRTQGSLSFFGRTR